MLRQAMPGAGGGGDGRRRRYHGEYHGPFLQAPGPGGSLLALVKNCRTICPFWAYNMQINQMMMFAIIGLTHLYCTWTEVFQINVSYCYVAGAWVHLRGGRLAEGRCCVEILL